METLNDPKPLLSVVVNAFNPKRLARLDAMVRLNLLLLAEYTTPPFEIILVDAGGRPDADLRQFCESHRIQYVGSESPLGFAEGYNTGIKIAKGDFIAVCASDILVCPGWSERLISEMRRTGAWMAVPTLNYADLGYHNRNGLFGCRTFRPVSVTINLNVMSRQTIDRVGLINEELSGAFNDVDYLLRIRKLGGDAIQVDAGNICHLGKATISAATSYSKENDDRLFRTLWTRKDLARNRLSGAGGYCYAFMETLIRLIPISRLKGKLLKTLISFQPVFYAR